MSQPGFFDEPTPAVPIPTTRRTDPDTSHIAAVRAAPKAGTNRRWRWRSYVRIRKD